MIVNKETVEQIKYAYNKDILYVTLFVNGEQPEDAAFEAFLAFSDLFSSLTYSAGLRDGSLSFVTNVLVGEPLRKYEHKVDADDDKLNAIKMTYMKYSFYKECLKKISTATPTVMIDYLIESMYSSFYKNEKLMSEYGDNYYVDFVEKKVCY